MGEEERAELMRNITVGFSTGETTTAEFDTSVYAEGLEVEYSITMSFLRPTSGPNLYQSEIQQIVLESLSDFLQKLEKEIGEEQHSE